MCVVCADQDHWLYVADLVLQGSQYPNGRHKFATAMYKDSAPYIQHVNHIHSQKTSKTLPVNRNSNRNRNMLDTAPAVQFDDVDLETLSSRTAPGSALLKSSQTTGNLQDLKSNTWATAVLGSYVNGVCCL